MSSSPYTKMNDANENASLSNTNSLIEEQIPVEKRKKILFITLFCFIMFTVEVFVREPFTILSEYFQERINFGWKCELANYLVYFKYEGKAVIFLFLYNVSNIYVSLTMILLDSFGVFINGTLKLIYLDPRPFWRNENLIPCTCLTNYGNPSTTSMDIYLVCIVVYKGLINKSESKLWKCFIWFMFLGPQIFAWISRYLQNVHSIHQLVFGLLIGYVIQYIYFEILEINMDSPEQLKYLINSTGVMITLALSTLAWVIFNLIHYFFVHIKTDNYMNQVIQRSCPFIDYYMFDMESYQKTAMAFLFIGSIYGIYIEYKYVFNSNFDKFSKYNMNSDRWTETSSFKTFLRIVVMYVLFRFVKKFAKFGDIQNDSVAYLVFGQCIVLNFVKGLVFFFFIKTLFRYLDLTNEDSNFSNKNKIKVPLNFRGIETESLLKQQ